MKLTALELYNDHSSIEKLWKTLDKKELPVLFNTNWTMDYKNQIQNDLPDELNLTEPHIGVFTSGSTGEPKLALISIKSLENSAQRAVDHLGLNSKSVLGCSLPLFHVGGLGIVFRSRIAKSKLIMLNPSETNEFTNPQLTHLSLVPTQLKRILDHGLKLSSEIILGGAKCDNETLLTAIGRGFLLRKTYGMTETSSMVTLSEILSSIDLDHSGSPLPGVDLLVKDSILYVKCNSFFTGYLEKQNISYLKLIDGYHKTQDIAQIHDNKLTVINREDRQIKIKGELVSLSGLELFLQNELKRTDFKIKLDTSTESLIYETNIENINIENLNALVKRFHPVCKFTKIQKDTSAKNL